MQIQDLVKAYQTKTDEELLQLAVDSGQLTPEARTAVTGELARRRIGADEISKTRDEMANTTEPLRVVGDRRLADSIGVTDFVAEVLRVYHNHFWFFFKLTLPAVVLGFIAVFVGRHEAYEIERHIGRGREILKHQPEILEMGLANYTGFLISWTALCFSFGAISPGVRQIETGATPSVSESLSAVRERISPLVRVSLLLFMLMLVGMAGAVLLTLGVAWAAGRQHSSRLMFETLSVGFVGLASLVLSRFALAIPAIVLDNCKVGQAMFRSDGLTEGKWPILAALLVKSLVGSYFAAMCPYWLAAWVFARALLPPWFHWVLTGVSIAGVTAVEPTMFIGFALLYSRATALSSPAIQSRLRPV